jgi:hypothetical protein
MLYKATLILGENRLKCRKSRRNIGVFGIFRISVEEGLISIVLDYGV